jgi:hypothetical protein
LLPRPKVEIVLGFIQRLRYKRKKQQPEWAVIRPARRAGPESHEATAMATTAASVTDEAAQSCPHVIFRHVLGEATVAALLRYVEAREGDFMPAVVRNRETGRRRVDYALRSALSLRDLGPFRPPIEGFVRKTTASALEQFRLSEPALEPMDFELTSFRDGGRFAAHIDTDERPTRVRALSCVYYFSTLPRRFTGGELRLFGLPTLSTAKNGRPAFVDVIPEVDTMVVFPSWLRHEVLPVRVPSHAWMHSRFTINCWLHRVMS